MRRAVATAVVAAVLLAPLAFLALGALRPPGEPPPTGLEVLVPEAETGSFTRAFELVDLGDQLINSAWVALLAVPPSVLIASWAGFAAVTLLGRRGRRLVLGASLAGLLVPASALWVPRFIGFNELGLRDSYVPLVAPALMATSPLFVLLFAWSYARLPRDQVDLARVEGLSPLRTWRRVASPQVRPTSFAVGALAFVVHWANFVDPLLYLDDPEKYTAPLGLRQLVDLGATDLPVLLAAALVVTLPAVLAFAAVQRRFLADPRAPR